MILFCCPSAAVQCFGENDIVELGIGSSITTDVGEVPTDMGENLNHVGGFGWYGRPRTWLPVGHLPAPFWSTASSSAGEGRAHITFVSL